MAFFSDKVSIIFYGIFWNIKTVYTYVIYVYLKTNELFYILAVFFNKKKQVNMTWDNEELLDHEVGPRGCAAQRRWRVLDGHLH